MKTTETIAICGGPLLRVEKSVSERAVEIAFILEGDSPCVMHWGLRKQSDPAWQLPSPAIWPDATHAVGGTAAQTSFPVSSGDRRVVFRLSWPPGYTAIEFALFFPERNCWENNGGKNYRASLSESAYSDLLLEMSEEIIRAEMSGNSWTLMHRFNLCHDLLDRVRDSVDGLAVLFVWLRFSALRQLTWQRKYNTQPRELSHAQDRLTLKIADRYRSTPGSRALIRLMLGTVGRGGEGQRIRDEILAIMHRHHIKEVTGHFLEEWHQKLHNNTTPDDIIICEAYLEFVRHDGNLELFYERLDKGGVTKERLKGFERPIKTAPDFVPHLKEALIHDFGKFLQVLNSVHASTDLESALRTAHPQLDPDTQRLLWQLWDQRNDPGLGLPALVERVTEARRRVADLLGRSGGREVLYLDLALEAFLRGAVERNIHLQPTGDQLVDLITLVLENLVLSDGESELRACVRGWRRLQEEPRFSRDWSLHAKSVLDRVSRVLSDLVDSVYQQLQPHAERLGKAFNAEPWTITLFSEQVVRGGSLGFVLSMLLHHLDPMLRRSAELGLWQIISRGCGSGRVRAVEALSAIQGAQLDRPTVIIADKVMGDEEIPENVVAVISPDETDIVSHVAVRARNAQLLFATCYDATTFQQLKALDGRSIELEVNAGGDVIWRDAEEPGLAAVSARPAQNLAARPEFARYVIAEADFNERVVGGKSYRQAALRGRLPDWLKQPVSIALPFGVFERVLAFEQNKSFADRYERLVREVGDDFATVLPKLRKAVLALAVPGELADALRQAMRQGGLAWPEPWERAWTCIKRVWASKWNERAFLSRKANGIAGEDLCMAVLIQQVVEAEYAFVIHTVNPFTGNPDELYAEVVLGLGETLVGNHPGRALGFVWDKKSGQHTMLTYPGKSVGLYGGGLIFRSDSNGEDLGGYAGAGLYDSVFLEKPRVVSLDYSEEPLVWDAGFRRQVVSRIAEAGMTVARTLGSPQDIEGVWAGGDCYIVQTRPQVGIDGLEGIDAGGGFPKKG